MRALTRESTSGSMRFIAEIAEQPRGSRRKDPRGGRVERGGRGEKQKGNRYESCNGAGHRLKLFTAITAQHRGRREVQWRRLNCPDA
jgi:hypothetical protein